jgi:molecular chaperone GrpE
MALGEEKREGPAGGDSGPAGAAPEQAAPASEMAEALREKEQFKKLLQRVQADFINYRNRAQEEFQDARRQTVRRIGGRVIEVMDLFDAAFAQDSVQGVPIASGWVEGMRAIQRSLAAALASEGIERMKIEGEQFDPRRHEALISTRTAALPAGSIIRELRPGYVKEKEVIRPAQVEVALPPSDDQGQPPPGAAKPAQ